ncbi:hypothetical protein RSSM_00569 [Rhodopirellula sallentina SM41]|uniref:Uncharacterized protein n=1 Tax=Rhodopirellula sallentina SM41 TaxID=1263870 RepID=M5U9E7_9BACT|nr:hypothetical protein RSSM_00569 [Rhodopirellula sallentina SM41]
MSNNKNRAIFVHRLAGAVRGDVASGVSGLLRRGLVGRGEGPATSQGNDQAECSELEQHRRTLRRKRSDECRQDMFSL